MWICIYRYTQKSICVLLYGAFSSHGLGNFPFCFNSAEFTKAELVPLRGRTANTTNQEHFCMRSKKPLNNDYNF